MSLTCMYCFSNNMERPANGHTGYLVCPSCQSIELTYEPMDYQRALHTCPVHVNENGVPLPQIIFVAGGYGSGKSRSSLQEFFIRCLENPNGVSLITAPTLLQLKRTSIKTLIEEIIPPPLIESFNKSEMEIRLVNGHVILAVASDDDQKLRSLNIGQFHLEEASGVDKSIYVQLLTRLRDKNTRIKAAFVCTNPDSGWVRDTFALNTSRANPKHPEHDQYNPFMHVFIWPTDLNTHLPPNFKEVAGTGRPDWWKRKFFEGSFEASEGAVYPEYQKCIIDPWEVDEKKTDEYGIPKFWERFVGLDHGLRNPTAVVFGAIDPEKGRIIIYNEYYVPNRLVPEHAKYLKPLIDAVPAGQMRFLVADPSTKNKTDPVNGKSVQALYHEYGMYFQPGNNAIEAGILRVNSYIERGAIQVYSTCVNLNREMLNYKFPELDIDDDKNLEEKPEKKNDHAPDALRYALMRLPDDPQLLKTVAYSPPKSYTVYDAYEYDYKEDYKEDGNWQSYV